jgi:3-hydroxyacyl-CoA dehydrogenase
MCTIGMDVLEGINNAIDIAEEQCSSMVIWQEQDIFSAGANLEEFGLAMLKDGVAGIDRIITVGHNIIAKKIRAAKIPIVAAVKGYVLGGGCELMLHCDSVVAALESYIGLVEAGVGLIPGWGGSTEMAYRASQSANLWSDLEKRYKTLALARVSGSAREAQELGFLRDFDSIVMNSKEVLYVAKEKAKFMASAGYRPPIIHKFKIMGQQGIANIKGFLVNMLAGNQISEHDNLIATSLASIMCGGEVDEDTLVSQDWLLNLEKEEFKLLATNPKSQARIQHMLTTGKPLRN